MEVLYFKTLIKIIIDVNNSINNELYMINKYFWYEYKELAEISLHLSLFQFLYRVYYFIYQ